jgi:hypothetical protein
LDRDIGVGTIILGRNTNAFKTKDWPSEGQAKNGFLAASQVGEVNFCEKRQRLGSGTRDEVSPM